MANQAKARREDAVAPFDRIAPVSRGASLPQGDSYDPAQGEVCATAGGAPSSSRHHYECTVRIPELFLVARYVRRPYGVKRLAERLVELTWTPDEALEFAQIVSRTAELACEVRRG